MLSAFSKESHQSFSLHKRSYQKPIWWLLGVTAIFWDASTVSAKLFLSRCISSPWWHSASPQYFLDHVSAYPFTAAWMISRCLGFKYGRSEIKTIPFSMNIALMLIAMVPACAVASLISPLVPPAMQTVTYGLIMVLSCELIMQRLVWCGKQITAKCD